MLKEMLRERGVMNIWDDAGERYSPEDWERRRKEIVELLCAEEYGLMPRQADELRFEVMEETAKYCAGKAVLRKVNITARFGDRSCTFPCYASLPTKEGRHPFFVFLNFRDNVPDLFFPAEEIIDNGFAVLSFCYKDVTSDDGDFASGAAGAMFGGKERGAQDCGKIMMWSWAASRVLDYAETLPNLDLTRAFVIGQIGRAHV